MQVLVDGCEESLLQLGDLRGAYRRKYLISKACYKCCESYVAHWIQRTTINPPMGLGRLIGS